MTLSDLAIYSLTLGIARPHYDSRASCHFPPCSGNYVTPCWGASDSVSLL